MTLKLLILLYMLIGGGVFLAISLFMIKIQVQEEFERYKERQKKERIEYNKQNFIGKIENFKI